MRSKLAAGADGRQEALFNSTIQVSLGKGRQLTDQRSEVGETFVELVQPRLVKGHHVGHLQ